MFQNRRGIFAGTGVIIVAVIVTVSVLAVGLNGTCQSRFWDNLQVYPGAELVDKQAEFLGLQRAVYHSADAVEVVNGWYASQDAKQMRQAATSDDFSNLPADNWVVDADLQHGGSSITFAGRCP